MPTHKISMQAIQNAVRASGNDVNVARILYQDIGVAIPDDATLASAGPHTSYHRKTREQAAAITADKNAEVEGADAPDSIAILADENVVEVKPTKKKRKKKKK